MPSSESGNSDFSYSDAGVAGPDYQPDQVPGQGGIRDATRGGYASAAGPAGYQNAPGQFSPQGSPGQVGQGQPGYQGFFGPGQSGYQGTPTPIGYQDPRFGQPGYGSRMWSAGGAFRRRDRNRYFWYIRIAFWLIVIGIILYVGFTTHTLIGNCTHGCGG